MVTINATGLSAINDDDTHFTEEGGFQIRFVRNLGNFTSVLHVSNLKLNDTNITCEYQSDGNKSAALSLKIMGKSGKIK